MSSNAYTAFQMAIAECDNQCQVGLFLENNSPAVDHTGCYRSAIALSVSALDFFVHHIIVEKALEIFAGTRAATKSTGELSISLPSVMAGSGSISNYWLQSALQACLKRRTFQKADDIAKGISYVYDKKLWPQIAIDLNTNSEDLRKTLNIIASKRDIIVHEADIDFSNFPSRNAIVHADATYAVGLIRDIVKSMEQILK